MTEPDDTEPDMTVALDIIDLRFRALEIAASRDDLSIEAIAVLANYYFNFGITGVIVPYPKPPDEPKPKKLKAVT